MDAFTAGAALIQHLHRSSQSRILIDLPEDNEPSQEQGVSESAPEPEEKGSQDSDPTASRPDVPKLDLGSVRIEALWFDDDVKDADGAAVQGGNGLARQQPQSRSHTIGRMSTMSRKGSRKDMPSHGDRDPRPALDFDSVEQLMWGAPACATLTRSARLKLAGLATHQRYEMGDLLFLPGQDASQVYFIVSGEVVLEVDGVETTYTAGSSLGNFVKAARFDPETPRTRQWPTTLSTSPGVCNLVGAQAMLGTPRWEGCATAVTDLEVLVVTQQQWWGVMREEPRWDAREVATFLEDLPIFGPLSRKELLAVARLVIVRVEPAGTVIYRQGTEGDDLYVVRSGYVRLLRELQVGPAARHRINTLTDSMLGLRATLESLVSPRKALKLPHLWPRRQQQQQQQQQGIAGGRQHQGPGPPGTMAGSHMLGAAHHASGAMTHRPRLQEQGSGTLPGGGPTLSVPTSPGCHQQEAAASPRHSAGQRELATQASSLKASRRPPPVLVSQVSAGTLKDSSEGSPRKAGFAPLPSVSHGRTSFLDSPHGTAFTHAMSDRSSALEGEEEEALSPSTQIGSRTSISNGLQSAVSLRRTLSKKRGAGSTADKLLYQMKSMRARPGHVEEEDDPHTHATEAVISAMNALASSPSQKRELMIQQQLAEQQQQQQQQQQPEQAVRGGSAEQRDGSGQQQRGGGSPGSKAYGTSRMTPAAKAAQIAAAAEKAFVSTNPRELWDEEGAVFVELGLLVSGRLFGGSNGPPGKRGGGNGLPTAPSSGAPLATSLSVMPSSQAQGDLGSQPSYTGGGGVRGKGPGAGTGRGSAEGVDVGAREPQASGAASAVSSWWGAGGLKRRAVSAVTDTRAELFVFRKEEVESRLGNILSFLWHLEPIDGIPLTTDTAIQHQLEKTMHWEMYKKTMLRDILTCKQARQDRAAGRVFKG